MIQVFWLKTTSHYTGGCIHTTLGGLALITTFQDKEVGLHHTNPAYLQYTLSQLKTHYNGIAFIALGYEDLYKQA